MSIQGDKGGVERKGRKDESEILRNNNHREMRRLNQKRSMKGHGEVGVMVACRCAPTRNTTTGASARNIDNDHRDTSSIHSCRNLSAHLTLRRDLGTGLQSPRTCVPSFGFAGLVGMLSSTGT